MVEKITSGTAWEKLVGYVDGLKDDSEMLWPTEARFTLYWTRLGNAYPLMGVLMSAEMHLDPSSGERTQVETDLIVCGDEKGVESVTVNRSKLDNYAPHDPMAEHLVGLFESLTDDPVTPINGQFFYSQPDCRAHADVPAELVRYLALESLQGPDSSGIKHQLEYEPSMSELD